jgi:hypothetical protein
VLQCPVAVGEHVDGVARQLEVLGQEAGDRRIVVDDQDPPRHRT